MLGRRIKLILLGFHGGGFSLFGLCSESVSAERQQLSSGGHQGAICDDIGANEGGQAGDHAASDGAAQRTLRPLQTGLGRGQDDAGKPIPVGPATRLAGGLTWKHWAMSPDEIREKGLFPKGFCRCPIPITPKAEWSSRR